MKTCSKCGQAKLLSEYYGDAEKPDGHRPDCKNCTKQNHKTYQLTDRGRQARRTANTRYRQSATGTIRHRSQQKNYAKHNPEKRKAQNALNGAIRYGKIVRPNKCEGCNRPERVHAHHEDYSKPLDVLWLCSECHYKVHNDPEWRKHKESVKDEFSATDGSKDDNRPKDGA